MVQPLTRSKFVLSWTRSCSTSAPCETRTLKSSRMRRVVSAPTAIANASRMTMVSSAELPARRQRIGRRLKLLRTEHVPRAADGVQQARLVTGLELAPQVRDEHLDGVRRRERVVAPDLLEQALARHDDPLVAHEELEQLELALGQLDLALAAGHLVGVGVELQVRADEARRAAGRAPAQQGAQAGEQLLALERLDQVVVGPAVEPFDARVDR